MISPTQTITSRRLSGCKGFLRIFPSGYGFLILGVLVFVMSACHEPQEWTNDPYGNFDALWTTLDEHYSFFEYKNIDWDAVGAAYRAKLGDKMTSRELFDLCAEMLDELQDGHTNLISSFDVSRYWIWEQYPVNYDERLIDQYYLGFDYHKASGIKYQILSSNFGYMYYGSFSSSIGEGNLDLILNYLSDHRLDSLSTCATTAGAYLDQRGNARGALYRRENPCRHDLPQKRHRT